MGSSRRRGPAAACAGRDTCRRSSAAGSDARAAGAGLATRRRLVRARDVRDPVARRRAIEAARPTRCVGGRRVVAPQVAARRGRLVDAVGVVVVRLPRERRLVAAVCPPRGPPRPPQRAPPNPAGPAQPGTSPPRPRPPGALPEKPAPPPLGGLPALFPA